MKKFFLAVVFLLGGCSGGINSSLLKMNVDMSIPFLSGDDRQAVVYPGQANGVNGDAGDPEWRNIEKDYPEYSFNH